MSQASTFASAVAGTKVGEKTLGDVLKGTTRVKGDREVAEVNDAFATLIESIVGTGVKIIPNNVIKTIKAAQAAIDKKLEEQVNLILHNPEFQQLESAWRGLFYLCKNSVTDETLKIKVLNVSKKELYKSLEKKSGPADWDKSDLYNKLHRDEFSQPGGAPYGALIGDYYFDHGQEDVNMLTWLSAVCGSCHCPFIAAADPSLMELESWQELQSPENITLKLQTPRHAAWNDMRKNEDSRYIALTLPRFLARPVYGKSGVSVDEFAFEEDVGGADHSRFSWANAAYAMGANITRAFKESGWTVQIRGKESGGNVGDLPVHVYESPDGDIDTKCPTEVAIDQRREAELSNNGLMPLSWWKGEPNAAFVGGQTLKEPTKWSTAEATANERLGCRLPYIFACSRFAHFLKKMVYDKIGAIKKDGEDWSSADGVKKTLQNWINMYVCPNPASASEQDMAERPLAGAAVEVKEDPENPGVYDAQFFLRPHFQLEGVNVGLSLVSKLPTPG